MLVVLNRSVNAQTVPFTFAVRANVVNDGVIGTGACRVRVPGQRTRPRGDYPDRVTAIIHF